MLNWTAITNIACLFGLVGLGLFSMVHPIPADSKELVGVAAGAMATILTQNGAAVAKALGQ